MQLVAMKNSEYNLLKDALVYDIISLDSVSEQIMNKQLEKIAKIHPYAITPPSTGGRWQTTYRDSKGNRKSVKAQSREELLKKLIPVYFSQEHIEKLTFEMLFEEWITYKSTVVNSQNTIKRHRQHYKKYFQDLSLATKKIKNIDELELESICNNIVRDNNMSRKEWTNVKTILNGMYQYAIRKKYITENPMNSVVIFAKYRQVVRKTGKTQVYNTEELESLNSYLDSMYSETHDTVFLAVKLNFLLGLRVGELVALKWDDVVDNKLHVVREEVRDQTTNSLQVVEHTKTNHDRFVTLVPKAKAILELIENQSEYIFMRDGARITARQINYVLEKYAERMGVSTKSSHKIRKTYASNLNAKGVPLDCIREELGHADASTTLAYIYNPLTETETYNLIVSAL